MKKQGHGSGEITPEHQSSSDRKSSAWSGRALKWIGITVALPLVHLLAAPWFALVMAILFPVLQGDNPAAKAFAGYLYPAIWLAENLELYGDYFWGVVAPLGG